MQDTVSLLCFIALIVAYLGESGYGEEEDIGSNKRKEEVTLIFGGDISFDGPVRYYANRKCTYNKSFSKIRSFLSDGDVIVANLESPFFDGDIKILNLPEESIRHVAEPKAVEALKYTGVNLVNLANNHLLDAGEEGVRNTINTLKGADIAFVGITTGKSATTRQKPVQINVNGISIGFLGYCAIEWECLTLRQYSNIRPAPFKILTAKDDISDLKDNVDIVVVIIHWGVEYLPAPPLYVRSWAFKLKQFGADIIVGGHPHVLQGHECIGKSLVTYSLGNLLFGKHGIPSFRMFLGGKDPGPDVANDYEKKTAEVYHPGQYTYLLKVKVNRNGITDAKTLILEIKSEPKTFCLQPTPVSRKWIPWCDVHFDPYCYDFQSIFAETFNKSRVNVVFTHSSGNQKCIQKRLQQQKYLNRYHKILLKLP